MAKVYLACEARVEGHPFARRDFERLSKFAALDRHGRHVQVGRPEEAEIIVFVGSTRPNFADIKGSELYRKFPEKTLIMFSGDRSITLLPGLYACLERHWLGAPRAAALAGYYLRVTENPAMDIVEDINQASYLFSFVGNARNHPVRQELCKLTSPRAYIRDSSNDTRQQDDGVLGDNRERGLLYRDVMARSKFVLCPRGVGVSSWRLFETMRAGRVPVVLSDDWIRPSGPNWDSFCLFVKERDVPSLPKLLESQEHLAGSFGATARSEWEKWYSEENVFNTTVDQLLVAHDLRNAENIFSRVVTYAEYLKPDFLRHWFLSPIKRRIVRRLFH